MDIEPKLREILVLQDPGTGFTDRVMTRVGDTPGRLPEGVVRISEARVRRRSRRILLVTVMVVGAAAAMPVFFLRGRSDVPAVQSAAASIAGESMAVDRASQVPLQQLQAQSGLSGNNRNPLDCVDPDVLHGLLLRGFGQIFRIVEGTPSELSNFKAPRQLSWVGAAERSATNGPSSVTAVYRTSLAPEAARIAAAGALTAGGWKRQADGWSNFMSVFTAVNTQASETYCRDGKPAGLTAGAIDGVTYVVVAMPRGDSAADNANACGQPPQPVAWPAAALDVYLPKLELPRDPATGQQVPMGGGSGGGGGDATRRMYVSFSLQDSVDNVARHFARQMAEQGWSAEANWSGARSAGSSWNRRADADSVLQGTLSIVAPEAGRFTVIFHVVRTK